MVAKRTRHCYSLATQLAGFGTPRRIVSQCGSLGEACLTSICLHSKIASLHGTSVAIPLIVGNFIIACVVDEIARSSLIPVRPKIMLYGDDASTTVNFIMVLRLKPSFPNTTSNLIFPIGLRWDRWESYWRAHPIFRSSALAFAFSVLAHFVYHVDYLAMSDAVSTLSPVVFPSLSYILDEMDNHRNDEACKRFVKSEEAFKNTELPKGEQIDKGHTAPYKGSDLHMQYRVEVHPGPRGTMAIIEEITTYPMYPQDRWAE
nr:hypothetical protein [Tanacetum cinerariifolium]